jgi:chromosome segregation ATPase
MRASKPPHSIQGQPLGWALAKLRHSRVRFNRWPVAALALVLALPVLAQQAASREQEQIRRLRQQVQQLQQELATQQQSAQQASRDKAEAERKLQGVQSEASRSRAAVRAGAGKVAELEQSLESLRSEHGNLQSRGAELQTELDKSRAAIAQLRSESEQRRQQLGSRDSALASLQQRHRTQAEGLQTCIVRNQALQTLGQELLQRWSGKGLGETLAVKEPFLRLNQVELENLVQGYQDKLDKEALAAASSGALPSPAPQ